MEYIELLIGTAAKKTVDCLKNLEGSKAVLRMAAAAALKKKPAAATAGPFVVVH